MLPVHVAVTIGPPLKALR